MGVGSKMYDVRGTVYENICGKEPVDARFEQINIVVIAEASS